MRTGSGLSERCARTLVAVGAALCCLAAQPASASPLREAADAKAAALVERFVA